MQQTRTAIRPGRTPQRADLDLALPPLLSARTLAVGWFMGSRLAAMVLAPGGIVTLLLLSPVGITALVSPFLILFYCVVGVAIAGCVATDHFAAQWAKREFGWTPSGRIWWGIAWRTGLVFLCLLALGWGLLATYPFRDSLAWALTALGALAALFGTTYMLGWSTLFMTHRMLTAATGDWEEDAARWADEVLGTGARGRRAPPPGAPPPTRPAASHRQGKSSPGRVTRPDWRPAPPPAPARAPARAAEAVRRAAPPQRQAPPRRPILARGGEVHTRFWQNVVGGWELEISCTPGEPDGSAPDRRVLYRTDCKPRPFGAPYGGFYSRALAEEFAGTHIEHGLELLNLDVALRRTPRYVVPEGLPALLSPVGGAKVHDLSLGGACAEHEKPLAPGQEVAIALELPAGRFGAPARVVWSAPARGSAPGGNGNGRFRSGLRFLAPAAQDVTALQAFLATA